MNPVSPPILLSPHNDDRAAGPAPEAVLSDQILASFSTHPQRLPVFFAMVCADLGTQLAAMKRALEAGDPAALRDAAHAATGVARGLRDPSLSRLTGEIEQQARGGDMGGGIEQKLAACMALYQPLIR